MFYSNSSHRLKAAITITAIVTIWIVASISPAVGHGGKSHGDNDFSSLQAVRKAVELYDRLIAMGKLPDVWETGLASIHVSTRQSEEKDEYVIQFKRIEGEPQSVYFFLDQKGAYIGSNFTGR